MKVLKICVFTETYYPEVGGGETQARALAESLTDLGFSVIVVTRRSDKSHSRTEQSGPVTIYRLPPTGKAHYKKWGLLFSSFPKLFKLRRHYDLIFVSGFRVIGLSAVLISRLLGKSCVLKADSTGEMSGDFFEAGLAKLKLSPSMLPFQAFLRLRNYILRGADRFVAISSDIARELSACEVDPQAIQRIPNSVDIKRFNPVKPQQKVELRRHLGLPAETKIVIYTGRLVSYKGLPLLVRVWKRIAAEHPQAMLLLVGSGGLDIHNCEVQLRAFVKDNELQKSILFTGSVENVHEYLQACDIFVFPTEQEAFGISLIEAMACGLPVISTAVGGVKDILEDQQNGLLVQSGDFQTLYETLSRLINDDNLAILLGQAARQTVHHRYSQDSVTQQYVNLFQFISG